MSNRNLVEASKVDLGVFELLLKENEFVEKLRKSLVNEYSRSKIIKT